MSGSTLTLKDRNKQSDPDGYTFKRKCQIAATPVVAILLLIELGYLKLLLVIAGLVVLGLLVKPTWKRTPRGKLRSNLSSDGWATAREIHKNVGEAAAASGSPGANRGTLIGSTTVGPTTPQKVWIRHEDVIGVIGGPRRGKTALMCHALAQHHGPALSVSARLDIFEKTIKARERFGPVWLYNPTHLGNVESTLFWSPLAGCEESKVAQSRASALVNATDTGAVEQQEWLMMAANVLRSYLYVAARTHRDMYDVYEWSTNSDDNEALNLLIADGGAPRGWVNALAEIINADSGKMREGVMTSVSQAVAFMTDPNVARSCCPEEGDPIFDVETLINQCGTLHVVGTAKKFEPTAPLVSALWTHVFDEAFRIGAASVHKKLVPAMMLAGDEQGVTIRVPLDEQTAYGGGAGIHIFWAAQNLAQLRKRWKQEGADDIWDNTTAALVFGGIKNAADLRAISELCGELDMPMPDKDDRARKRTRLRPLMPVNQVMRLQKFHALLLHPDISPTILHTQRIWSLRIGKVKVPVAETAPVHRPMGKLELVEDAA